MLMEVYYEHYAENRGGRYWEMEDRSLPYLVLFPTVGGMLEFIRRFDADGLRSAGTNHDHRGLLVNLGLKRYAVIGRACRHACVDDRTYSPEEFAAEVYEDWRASGR